jgi:hypothetical protein
MSTRYYWVCVRDALDYDKISAAMLKGCGDGLETGPVIQAQYKKILNVLESTALEKTDHSGPQFMKSRYYGNRDSVQIFRSEVSFASIKEAETWALTQDQSFFLFATDSYILAV